MIGTKGRISFLQYLPKKPKKWGIKLWVLAESLTGYVSNFEVYTGASDTTEHGLAYSVVMNLIDSYLYLGHRLYVDNFYTSPKVFMDLLSKETNACGTVRVNRRGLPRDVQKLQRGEAVFKKSASLTYVQWKDKRDVFCLSTFHTNKMSDFTTRRRDVGDIQRPDIISSYNQHMGGVDHMDQLLVYYTAGRKTMKWYKRIFWRIIEMSIVNVFILYNLCHPDKKMTQKMFRLKLADSLVANWINEKAMEICSPGRRSVYPSKRLQGKHFATTVTKRGRCKVCGNKKKSNGKRKDTKTNTFCTKCEVHVCLGKCFEMFHTKYHYNH